MKLFPFLKNSLLCMLMLLGLTSATPLATSSSLQKQILYFMQQGNTRESLTLYQKFYEQTGVHHFELLEQLGLILLDQGSRIKDPEIQLMTMFGAGIAGNDKTLYLLEEGLKSPYPQLQLVCLNLVASSYDDKADDSLLNAMLSSELLVRFEAAFHLAKKKHPQALAHIESLMIKLPDEVHALFPQLLALVGTNEAFMILRKMMSSPNRDTRLAVIHSIAQTGRDDFLPQIRILASHHDIRQQETCAKALGLFKDETAIPLLERLAQSTNLTVALAALQALYNMGDQAAGLKIISIAKRHELFATALLGELKGTETVLKELISNSPHPLIKLNASLALLEKKDRQCIPILADILIHDSRDLAFVKTHSPGQALSYWKIIPSAQHNLAENPVVYELSVSMREEVLAKTLELPEEDFLKIASLIFELEQNDLVPSLVELLENLQTPGAIDLLKKYQQKTGAPLIRNYCNLALYRLKIPGSYAENLKKWISEQQGQELIRFRPFVPWEARTGLASYHLTPHETSRLLIESFESLARSQNNEGIQVLLEAIKNGNQTNKYALAGLLLRSIQ
ncbi:MAG: hypothetical protein CK425_00355 [Parachlamydia sp.]|nr:MAG: hypothetical protein CK425_00355 [Parachlamydia sp.]